MSDNTYYVDQTSKLLILLIFMFLKSFILGLTVFYYYQKQSKYHLIDLIFDLFYDIYTEQLLSYLVLLSNTSNIISIKLLIFSHLFSQICY